MKPEQFFNDFYTIKPSKSEKVEVEALEPIICEYFRYASWEEKQKIEEEIERYDRITILIEAKWKKIRQPTLVIFFSILNNIKQRRLNAVSIQV